MNSIINILGEILFDIVLTVYNNDNLNKYLRYILSSLIVLFYAFIILGLFILGFKALEKSIFAGLFLMIISLFIVYTLIVTYRKVF